MNFLFSPKKRNNGLPKKPQGHPDKPTDDVVLSERPLTIGCCQPPVPLNPNAEMKRSSTDNSRPASHGQLSSVTAETNYEGQGSSPQRLPPRRQNAGWWDSSSLPDPILSPDRKERGQRKRSGQSSGSSTTDDGGLSVIDKEDLLDTIFVSCDTQGIGRVAVSKVIQHIQMIIDSNETRDIDELTLQLDPMGCDPEINLATYQNGIAKWIKNVQNQRKKELNGAMEKRTGIGNTFPAMSTPEIASHWTIPNLDGGTGQHRNVSTPLSETRAHWRTRNTETSRLFSGLLDSSLDLSACSYGSLETEGGESAPDMGDLQNQIEDLKFQIRKLTEHNMKLQVQNETTDDTNEQLITQIETLKGELKSLQQAWHRSQSIRDENEELKNANKEWHRKHTQLERDKRVLDEKMVNLQSEANKRKTLETKLQEVQEKLSISLAEADCMQEEHRRLQTLMQEYKDRSEVSEGRLELKNTELTEKAKRCEEMQVSQEELYNLIRDLKSEKTQLEVKLSEVHQELDSYRTQQLIAPNEEACSPTSPRTESRLGRSLHSELRSLVSAEGDLPSPICGNEDFDFGNHIGGNSGLTPDTPLSRQQSSSSSTCSSSSSKAAQLLRHFRQRKEDVMSQLQAFLDENDEELEEEDTGLAPKVAFTQLLDNELDSMIEKMTLLAKTKKQFEQRANKLSFMLQSLQDDYVRITKKYEEAIKHCKELTTTKSHLEAVRMQNETLQFDIQRGKQKTEELEKDLSSCQQDLESAHTAQQNYRQMAETQLGELRRLFKEMEKKYKIAQDNTRKQEASYKAKVAQQAATHRAQLKSLLDLVTRDSCLDQPLSQVVQSSHELQSNEGCRSDKQVLETILAYLGGLKTQLAKVRGQLISLKREKFCLEHRQLQLKRVRAQEACSKKTLPRDSGEGHGSGSRDGSCSVLLDALTLEVIDKASEGHSNSLLLHHQSTELLRQQTDHHSQDDSLVDSLRDAPGSVVDKLHFNLLCEFKTKKTRLASQTVATQTEIKRTPDRLGRPCSRSCPSSPSSTSSHSQTSLPDSRNRDTNTQTETDSADEFRSSSLQTTRGADIRQAYLVSRPPALNSAILLAVNEASSPGDSASDLSDSFVTAFSSPVSSSPSRGSFRGFPERDDLSDILASPLSRNDSPDSPNATAAKELSDSQEESPNIPVAKPDIKLQYLRRKSAQDRQDAAQKMADMLANSYARPNIVVEGCQADSEDNDANADYDRSGIYSPPTPKKLSPARLKRRSYVDKDKEKRSAAFEGNGLELLLSGSLPDVDVTEKEKEITLRLLEASEKASERHKNRRGRRWSPSTSPEQRSLSPNSADRSRSPSPSTRAQEDQSPPSTPTETPQGTSVGVTDPTTDKVTEGTAEDAGELQEERTGAEGESDKEDNKQASKNERKDSEVEVFDIKADILKATGSLQVEMPQGKPILPLAKLREEHKQHRKTNLHFTMPELTEATEVDQGRENPTPSVTTPVLPTVALLSSSHPTPVPGSPGPEIQCKSRENSTTVSEEEEKKEPERLDEEKSLIPDSILNKLGLRGGHSKNTRAMTENEIEEKFMSLQLAFKANQYTLDQRQKLQHRQRDLAEKNIDIEIDGLQQALQLLEPLASIDMASRDCINRIKQHIEVLQSSSLRLSSKAEGFGAVQQEGRLSKATDVMITHVENLKRLFEREHAELEDTRKLLQENRKLFRGTSMTNNLCIDGDTDSRLLSRRAVSVCGVSSKKPTSLFQLAKMLIKNASGQGSTKGKPVVTTQIRTQSEIRKRSLSCVSPPRLDVPYSFLSDPDQTGRRRASVATVVGSGLLSSSYGSQPLSFGGQHSRSQTEPSGISLGQGSQFVGGVRRTSAQLSSSLNAADFKEAKARLAGSLSPGKHSPLSRTDSTIIINRRASDDSLETRHASLEGTVSTPALSSTQFSPLSSPSRKYAVSLPATPVATPATMLLTTPTTSPKTVDPEAAKKDLARANNNEPKNVNEEDKVFRQGYEEGIRSNVTHELAELREQQKAFCDNLEDLIDHAEEEEEERQEADRGTQAKKSSNKLFRRLQELSQRWPRAAHIARLILTLSVFLLALAFVFTTIVPLESCLNGSPVSYSPWRTLKEFLWPYTELRHRNQPPR